MDKWGEYYKEPPIQLGEQSFAYKRAVEGLRIINADVLRPDRKVTCVLGGFHNAWAVADFKKFVDEVHSGEHTPIVLDINLEPLKSIDQRSQPQRLQASLEALPFQPNSVDLLILDFTLNFMNEAQVQRFAQSANEVLTPTGVVLAPFLGPKHADFLTRLRRKLNTHVPIYYHSLDRLTTLGAPLKPVLNASFLLQRDQSTNVSMIGWAKENSSLPRYTNKPLYFTPATK